MRIAILAYDNCLASGVNGFADVFAVADLPMAEPVFTVRVLSRDGKPVRCLSGTALAVNQGLDGPGGREERWDAIYVPPAFGLTDPPPWAAQWIARAHASGALACAACAGVFFLAQAGILVGRAATTHWGLAETFAARFPEVRLEQDRMLVDGGDYICAGGVTAYFDLALHLVARFASAALAASCARTLLLDPGRSRQTPYMSLVSPSGHADAPILQAQQWLEDNHARPLRISELAAAVHMSERTLLRRFKKTTRRTPLDYLQAVRIEHAKRLLESGGLAVGEIAAQVGYGDTASFFRLFKELAGLTPGEYRKRFRCWAEPGVGKNGVS